METSIYQPEWTIESIHPSHMRAIWGIHMTTNDKKIWKQGIRARPPSMETMPLKRITIREHIWSPTTRDAFSQILGQGPVWGGWNLSSEPMRSLMVGILGLIGMSPMLEDPCSSAHMLAAFVDVNLCIWELLPCRAGWRKQKEQGQTNNDILLKHIASMA